MQLHLTSELNHISFSILSPTELELRMAISVKGSVHEIAILPILSAIQDWQELVQDNDDHASIILYIVQISFDNIRLFYYSFIRVKARW